MPPAAAKPAVGATSVSAAPVRTEAVDAFVALERVCDDAVVAAEVPLESTPVDDAETDTEDETTLLTVDVATRVVVETIPPTRALVVLVAGTLASAPAPAAGPAVIVIGKYV